MYIQNYHNLYKYYHVTMNAEFDTKLIITCSSVALCMFMVQYDISLQHKMHYIIIILFVLIKTIRERLIIISNHILLPYNSSISQ